MTETEIDTLLKLLDGASERKVDLTGKVIHFNGYSFIFRNQRLKSRESYATDKFSSKFSSAGFWRTVIRYSIENLDRIKSLKDINLEDTKRDFLFGGSLKTILPSLKFGGDENLFDVWMFVKTPEDYIFPATFYFGQSGTSLGGWSLMEAKKAFPPKFYSLINFSPFNFSPDELDGFIEALEISLKMVPVSDYHGIYQGDYGYSLMGVKNGRPYLLDLGWSYDKKRIDEYVNEALR